MPRPKKVSDEEILQTARRMFLQHGHTLATAEIADELGISQATIFKRFPTKDDLLLAALAPPRRPPWVKEIEKGPAGEDFPAELRNLVETIFKNSREMIPCLMVLKSSGIFPPHKSVGSKKPPPYYFVNALTKWFEIACQKFGIEVEHPGIAAGIIFGSIHNLFFNRYVLGIEQVDLDSDKTIDNLTDFFLHGLNSGADG